MTKRNTILKIIIEAVLIFGSVYGAFLLEARRSINFERNVLIGKLEKLIEDVDSDSIKLVGTFQDISDSIFNVNLYEEYKNDSIAVLLIDYQKPDMYDSIWSMFINADIFVSYDEDVWIESWDNEYSIYRQVMNSSNLFVSPRFYDEIKKYRWRRELLFNEWTKKLDRNTNLDAYLKVKYNFLTFTEKANEQIIDEPMFQNSLLAELIQNEHLIQQSQSVLGLIPDIKTTIKEEIKAQEGMR